MKITVDVDVTPQELREFLGLPNVEKIQTQLVKNAEAYLKEASGSQYGDFIAMAMQPMLAYQQWLQRMMTGGESRSAKGTKGKGGAGEKVDE